MPDPLYERIYRFLTSRQKRAVEVTEQFALGTMVGSVRNRNEDVAIIVNVRHAQSHKKDYIVAVVCDGMGGMVDGQQAALIAASTFVSRMLMADSAASPTERLKGALAVAQREVFEEFRGQGGTTLSALFIDNAGRAWLAHVGDSRIYAVTLDGELRQLSRDDTIGAALNREKEKRPDFGRLIQFIGVDGDLDPQVLSINSIDYSGFLLTSDGAHSAPSEILSIVAHHAKDGPELVRKLLNLSNVLGGLDNATAIYVPSVPYPDYSVRADGESSGLLATILCASGEHDIWITQIDANDMMRGREQDRSSVDKGSHGPETQVLPVKTKGAKRKKSARTKPPQAPVREELPFEAEKPKAKLDFSDDEEPNS